MHLNALFTLRTAGACTAEIKARTSCYSHPGNYFGALTLLARPSAGLAVEEALSLSALAESVMADLPSLEWYTQHQAPTDDAVLEIAAGTAAAGLTVRFAAVELRPSAEWRALTLSPGSSVFVLFPHAGSLLLLTSEFVLRVDNSDLFVNTHVAMTPQLSQRVRAVHAIASPAMRALAEASLPHGLLGQTWSERVWNSRLKVVEGEVDDYTVEHSRASRFPFSRFAQ